MLKDTFYNLLNNYSSDNELIDSLWYEIYVNYNLPDRHYHNLSHLENVITELLPIKEKIKDWDTVLYSVFYHDLVYKSTNNKNEEDSAIIAGQRLGEIDYSNEKILKCRDMIIATKGHSMSSNSDTNYFIDADLSILGKGWVTYFEYSEKIRKEYSIYPFFRLQSYTKKSFTKFSEYEKNLQERILF